MATAVQSFQGVFDADPVHSSFGFAVRHMKVASFRATFEDVDARLVGDADGVRLEGAARVESVSIKSPPEFREHVVRGAGFFDADRHPEVTFRSDRVTLDDTGEARVEGELTIKGITKPVNAAGTYQPPIEDPYGSTRTALELSATVDRRDWELTWQAPLPKGGDVLGWDVELIVHLELIKQA